MFSRLIWGSLTALLLPVGMVMAQGHGHTSGHGAPAHVSGHAVAALHFDTRITDSGGASIPMHTGAIRTGAMAMQDTRMGTTAATARGILTALGPLTTPVMPIVIPITPIPITV